MKPVLIEGGSYPAHKVCGEFFSGECLPMLEQWDIVPEVMIQRAHFFSGNQQLSFRLPLPAGSIDMGQKRRENKTDRIVLYKI